MRGNAAKIGKRCTRAADQLMLNAENGFDDHSEVAFKEQVVNTDDGTGESVFDRSEKDFCGAFRNGGESGIEGGARDGGDGFAEKADGCGFAESAALALEGDAGGFELSDQLVAPDGEARRLTPTLQGAMRADGRIAR